MDFMSGDGKGGPNSPTISTLQTTVPLLAPAYRSILEKVANSAIDPERLVVLLQPHLPEEMAVFPVNRMVKNPLNESFRCLLRDQFWEKGPIGKTGMGMRSGRWELFTKKAR
jgi:hypothetical protein